MQADALVDLKTEENKLSLFIVDDDLGNLERIAAAIAAKSTNPGNFDYVLLERQAIENLGYTEISNPGETPDQEVNNAHIDLLIPYAHKLADLAFIFWNEGDTNRIRGKDIQKWIREGKESGQIKLES
ncbi:MAG: hypothetical protein OXH77_11665 [Anaerolineaceae bacterium]|nr:hypothetical protein [Anaerolineaceae bacterium]